MPDDLATRVVDAINAATKGAMNIGPRAKGFCVEGEFTATAEAAQLTRAAHFQGKPVPVTVRFSSGTLGSAVHHVHAPGLADKFQLPHRATTDILPLPQRTFLVRTPHSVPRSGRLRNARVEPHDCAPAEEDGAKKIEITQRHRGEGHAGDVTDHDNIDHAHG